MEEINRSWNYLCPGNYCLY